MTATRGPATRYGGRLVILTLLVCAVACQTQSWEQYMEAAAFAYQDQDYEAAETWFVAAEQIADFYHAQARDAEAEPLYLEALALLERIDGPESPRVARFVADLALFYAVLDRDEEAEPLFQRALDTLDWELGPDHSDVLIIRTALAGLYLQRGHYRDAEPLYREVLALTRSQREPDRDRLLTVLQEYALVLRGMDRINDALDLEASARAIRDAL
jgi:tetratricopeptide (TPR) repeat protein